MLAAHLPRSLDISISEIFILWDNSINGSIPNTLSGICSRLHVISLATNKLTGTIPNFFDKIPNLYYFSVGLNSINGAIKNSFNAHTSLTELKVYANLPNGTIPFEFRTLPSL